MDDGGWLGHTELGGDVVGDPSGSAEIAVDEMDDDPGVLIDDDIMPPPRIFRVGRLGHDERQPSPTVTPPTEGSALADIMSSSLASLPWMDADRYERAHRAARLARQLADSRPSGSQSSAARYDALAGPTVGRRTLYQETRRAALEAALAREAIARPPQAILDMDARVPEDLIDAFAQHAALASTSFTTPTNHESLRRLRNFEPEVVGSGASRSQASGESSRSQSPFVTPLPTMPGGRLAHKRRRAATLTEDRGELSRYRQALALSQQLAVLPALPAERVPAYMRYSTAHISTIPTELNELDRCERITLSCPKDRPEALLATFSGDGLNGDEDAAAVRADRPIPRGSGIYYYEAEVISIGVSGYIAIGMCNKYTDLARLTGWEKVSFAWHLDDGYFFKSQGHGTNMGWPKSTVGDVIGCGVDVDSVIFFTKNGKFIGRACEIPVEVDSMFPAIGLRTPGECLKLNFSGPFKFDIEQRARDAQQKVLADIASAPICVNLSPESDRRSSGSSSTSRLLDMLQHLETEANDKPPSKKSRASPARESVGLVRRPRVSPDKGRTQEKAGSISKAETSAVDPVKKSIADIDTRLSEVVLDYLRHGGFAQTTARLLPDMQRRNDIRQTGITAGNVSTQTSPVHIESDSLGTRIRHLEQACLANNVEEVISRLQADFPGFWAQHCQPTSSKAFWGFNIRLITFVELVRLSWQDQTVVPAWVQALFWGTAADEGAAAPARELLDVAKRIREMFGGVEFGTLSAHLAEAFGLLAYAQLEDVPLKARGLLGRHRFSVFAAELLRDIREFENSPSESVLEQAFRQAKHTHQSLTGIFGISEAAYTGRGIFQPASGP